MRAAQCLAAAVLAAAIAPVLAPGSAEAALWPFGGQPAKPAAAKPIPAAAQVPAQPAAKPSTGTSAAVAAKPPFHVRGFRSAQFGMTQEQVLAAIAADFKVPADKVQTSTNSQEHTAILTATVDSLDPGHGPATLSYVFGASSHRLVRVGVAWVKSGEPSVAERAALVNDGVQLVNYFRGQTWADGAVRGGVPAGPNALALFVGQDPDGSAVEVDVQGVAYEQQQNGKTIASPPPKGDAALTLVYTQDIAHPDIFRLPDGAF